jgi:cation transport ATPase
MGKVMTSSDSETCAIYRTIFEVPKMDCPAEEQMIRLALEDMESVRKLGFDLEKHKFTVWHSGDADSIAKRVIELGLGARLLFTSKDDAGVPRERPTGRDIDESRILWLLLTINAVMFIAEFVAGWIAESTGLIADSLDMFADAGVYGLSLYAVGRAARLKLRAAHLSGWFQLVLALGALIEVIRRFVFGSEPEPPLMIGVAVIALIANVTCLLLLARHREGEAHMKASWIFSTNDVIANLGVIVAGVLVGVTGSRLPDLVIGSIIGVIVLSGAMRILRMR